MFILSTTGSHKHHCMKNYAVCTGYDISQLIASNTTGWHQKCSMQLSRVHNSIFAMFAYMCNTINDAVQEGVISLTGKVTVCLMESNDSLPPGL